MSGKKLVGLATLVLLFAACARPSATPAKTFGKITVGDTGRPMVASTLYIADALGYFKEQGFEEVELVQFSGGTPLQNAIQAGDVQFGWGGFSGVADSTAEGKAQLAIVGLSNQAILNWVMRKETAQQRGITEKSSIEEKFKALKGLRVAVTSRGSVSDEITRFTLIKSGIDPDREAEIIALARSAVPGALIKGELDAFALSPPDAEIAIGKGAAIWLVKFGLGEWEPLRGYEANAVFGSTDFIKANPELTQALVNATVKASKLILDNPNEAKRAVRPYFADLEEAVFEMSWADIYPALADPEIKRENVDKVFEVSKVVWGKEPRVTYEQVVDNSFVLKAKEALGWR
ncbi:MAG: ABC transporter substrate-binding protein [Chloroflexi bacterium]|nr:ABC transporter substrate-binding protein [Chloroflexota bacterium]